MNKLLEELKPHFAKGLTDKEIAKAVKKPIGTIRLYRADYEKDLFSKIQPKTMETIEGIKSQLAAVDYLDGVELLENEIRNLASSKDEKVTKKDIAFELFAKDMSVEEIMKVAGLSYNSVLTYRTQYNKLLKRTTETGTNHEMIQAGTVEFSIANITVIVDTYVDQTGCEWVELSTLRESIKRELGVDIKKVSIAERYIKLYNNNSESMILIDKYALPILAKEVGDFKLTDSIMNFILPKRDIFSKAQHIAQICENIDELLGSADKVYEQIQAYDKAQQDILHDIEKNDYTEQELLRKATAIRDLRRARRVSKNEMALIKNIRNSLNGYKIKYYMVRETGRRLSTLIDDLYSKKYNLRVDELNETQKESINKFIC